MHHSANALWLLHKCVEPYVTPPQSITPPACSGPPMVTALEMAASAAPFFRTPFHFPAWQIDLFPPYFSRGVIHSPALYRSFSVVMAIEMMIPLEWTT